MSDSICVPEPVIVPFTQPDPPKAEPIERAIRIILGGFETYRASIDCTNDRIDSIISGGAQLLVRRNSGPSFGPRPRLNFIEGTNVQIALVEDAVDDEFDVTISVPGPFGDVTGGANVGAAAGLVFRDKTGSTLNFRSINPLSPLLGLTLGDQVLIAVVTNPVGASEVVGSNRVINGTSPIRINGGASSTLANDITVSYQFNPRVKAEFWEEFIGLMTFPGFVSGQNGWQIITAGGNALATAIPGETDHPGIIRLQIADSSEFGVGDHVTMVASDGAGFEPILNQGGERVEFCVRVSYTTELGLNGNNIITRVGLGDDYTGADFTNGIYFEYNPFVTQNWRRCTADNGTRTKTDTGILVTGLFTPMSFVSNGTSVEFFIDGNSVGTNNANVPVTTGREIAPILQIVGDTFNEVATQLIAVDEDYYFYENTQISR